jgi:predicted alpha-1,2-mannosidase
MLHKVKYYCCPTIQLQCSIRCVALLYAFFIMQQPVAQTNNDSLYKYVNPFIGTANAGNTYPHAVVPHGMIAVGATNDDFVNKPSYHAVSYTHGGSKFYGISHTQISGVGCPDKSSIILFPQSDSIQPKQLTQGVPISNEIATTGFYSCTINNNIQHQATVSTRSSIEQFSFSSYNNYLVLNLSRSLSKTKGAFLQQLNAYEIVGYQMEGMFCGRSQAKKLFFIIRFSQPMVQMQLMDNGVIKPMQYAAATSNQLITAIHFGNAKNITVSIGISYTSQLNAVNNLQAEIGNKSFAQIHKAAQQQWQKKLQVIQVKGGTTTDKIKFYTALYHTLLHPNIISDVTGDYPVMGNNQITANNKLQPRYTTFSLWDTYRTVHPLLTLCYPLQQQQMVNTMISMYKENGWLPKWEVGASESYTMVGDPAVPVITDAYKKGIKNIDIQTAYKAMLQQSSKQEKNSIRPGYNQYLQYGYIPNNNTNNSFVWGSVSTTLEYAYADWCIAQIAQQLGYVKQANTYLQRSKAYQYFFDSSYLLFRPKLSNGQWVSNFLPTDNFRELGWKPSGGIGFVEGSSWEYTWFVPHDIHGLKTLFGSNQLFKQQLQKCFDSGYFKLSNEPDMAYPWLFNYVKGEEYNTQIQVAKCINQYFGIDANGLPGNDDCGTLSAWLVWAMMGLYPDCPGSNIYQTTLPVFDEVIITLNNQFYKNKTLHIKKLQQQLYINNKKVGATITHQQITSNVNLAYP